MFLGRKKKDVIWGKIRPQKENGPPATSLHDTDTGSHSCLKWKRAYQSATEHPAVSLLLSSSSSSSAAAQGSICPSYPVETGLDSEPSPAQTLPTVQTCRGWNGYRWLPVFAAAAATYPLCENCHLADLFHSKPLISLSDEKKKTKVVDSELNPVWNEVALILSQLDRRLFKHADSASDC